MRLLLRHAIVARLGCYLGGLMLMDPNVVAGQTSPCPGIHVTVLNIRNSIGTVDCALSGCRQRWR
jgi:hypothetical protein